MKYILAIETSCDETGISLLGITTSGEIRVLADELASQADTHIAFGGVVPELASREHLRNLPILVEAALKKAAVKVAELSLVAVTIGPGLKGCLLMGTNFAKGLALSSSADLMGINHIEGHLYSAFIGKSPQQVPYPFLALVVSGGHTEIVRVNNLGDYQILARTLDDAAGEAFDKSANLLGFDYPGGPKLAALADTVKSSSFILPKVMREAQGFSFSGLKTAIALLIKSKSDLLVEDSVKAQICFSIQESICDTLMYKLKGALTQTGIKTITVVGGVSANRRLRELVASINGVQAFFPNLKQSTDNAAMIGYVAALRYLTGAGIWTQDVYPRWPVDLIGKDKGTYAR